ncbi:MAG: hypothetical protein CMP62_01990 [Flavobacteriales bacterium]|nr:hypothetical protein [Flavobacteriales bacterium]|tara:strand:+ start:521 stop:1930 length:1410 start_codon:yes stop_codon:yes gene_type:complete
MNKLLLIFSIPFLSFAQIYPTEFCDSIGGLGLYAFPSQSCPGENNAMINLYPTAGTPPYTYLWSNGATTEDIDSLSPGLYSVTVIDSNGICDTISKEISEYSSISFYQTPNCPGNEDGMVYFNSTGCDCNNSFCQWIWEFNGDTIAQGDGSTAAETYKYLFNIGAGTYTATIIHPDGCQLQENIIVPDATMIDSTYIQHECNGNGNGFIDLTVTENDSIIQNYLWNTGETTQDIYNLSSGSYSVIITDTICVDTLYFEVNNNNFEELLIVSDYDITGPTFTPAPETYNMELNIIEGDLNCAGILNLWIGTTTSEFSWSGNDIIIGYNEFGDCSGDWCINISDSPEFVGWSQITLTFKSEGVYVFNSYMNGCPDDSDLIEITVTDNCNFSMSELNTKPKIYTDFNNNLIINLSNDQIEYTLELFDMNGKKIIESRLDNLNNIKLENYQAGIYGVRLLSPSLVYTNKIIIH